MRLALISDIHGNAVALRSVLSDIARAGVDEVVCLGDVATLGPSPAEVLEVLKGLGCACVLGNHDEFLLDPDLVHRYTQTPIVLESVEWCRSRLTDADLDFLATFPRTLELPLEDGSTISLFHGSPRSHMEVLLATTLPEALDELLGERRTPVMAGGHTHVQMLRQHRGTLLVNPGSVGLPFREFVDGGEPTLLPHAEYAVIESASGGISVDLRRVPVERAEAERAVEVSRHPMREMLRLQYRA